MKKILISLVTLLMFFVAKAQNNNHQLVIKEQGVFAVGGTIVKAEGT